MVSGEKEYTKSGTLKRPGLTLVVDWVNEAWKSIPEKLVKFFKKSGILNALDGTEDAAVYEYLEGTNGENASVGDHSDFDDELNDFCNHELMTDEKIKKLF